MSIIIVIKPFSYNCYVIHISINGTKELLGGCCGVISRGVIGELLEWLKLTFITVFKTNFIQLILYN